MFLASATEVWEFATTAASQLGGFVVGTSLVVLAVSWGIARWKQIGQW